MGLLRDLIPIGVLWSAGRWICRSGTPPTPKHDDGDGVQIRPSGAGATTGRGDG